MESLTSNEFNIILTYLPIESMKAFVLISKVLGEKIAEETYDNLLWKRKVERLIGEDISTEFDTEDWRRVYHRLTPSSSEQRSIDLLYDPSPGVVRLGLQLGLDPSMSGNRPIIYAAENGHSKVVSLLMSDSRINLDSIGSGYVPDKSNLLERACFTGQVEVVSILLQDERINPSANKSLSLFYASMRGHSEIVAMLFRDGRISPSFDLEFALVNVCISGSLRTLLLMLRDERADPSYPALLEMASEGGHAGILSTLLQYDSVDPSADNNAALKVAVKRGRGNVVSILLRDRGSI